MKRPSSAVWLMNKKVGATSASVVDDFRRAHQGNFTLKVSHGGVLDPFAEGLVIVLVGAANRLFEALHEVPKRYVATLEWGLETDTGDAAGREIKRGENGHLDEPQLERALAGFLGWTNQVPPATSNKRVDGERAYVRAHRGEAVTLPAHQVFLHSARWLTHHLPSHSQLEVVVRGGFYVRSLAVDLGKVLGCGAHLSALKRQAIGPWEVPAQPQILTGAEVLPWLSAVDLSDAQWGDLRAGRAPTVVGQRLPSWVLPEGFPVAGAGVRAFHQGRLVALLRPDGTSLLLPGGI
jgi:tRNA pseudouridine55 synthase